MRRFALLLIAMASAARPASAQIVTRPEVTPMTPVTAVETRPSWAVDGVPDTVWLLVEVAAVAENDEAKQLLIEAEEHARAAVVGFEEDIGRRFALAVVLGLRANREGGRTKVGAASDLHTELEAILELDENHARARHLLGRLHAGVLRMNRITRWIATNLLGGGELKKATWAEAERHLVFAEQEVPVIAEHHLQLANLYRDTDRPELALQEIEHVLALPVRSALDITAKEEAARLREDLGG